MSIPHRKEEWIFLTFTSTITFFISAIYWLQAPFFPQEAEIHGLSATAYGIIISLFSVTALVFSPLLGHFLDEKHLVLSVKASPIITSVSCIVFSLVHFIDDTFLFSSVAVALRIVEGIGKSLFFVSSTTLLTKCITDRSFAFSVTEFSSGMGQITGPILFDAFGFLGSFLVFGSVMLIISIAASIIIKIESQQEYYNLTNDTQPTTTAIPAVVWWSLSCVVLTAVMHTFILFYLEPHIKPFGLTGTETGLVFMSGSIFYTAGTPVWGKIASACKLKCVHLLVTAVAIAAVGYSVIGPLPIGNLHTSIPLACIGFGVFSIGVSGMYLLGLLISTRESAGSQTVISYYQASKSLGNVSGAIIGGILVDTLGFVNSTAVFLALSLVFLLSGVFIICRKAKQGNKPGLDSVT